MKKSSIIPILLIIFSVGYTSCNKQQRFNVDKKFKTDENKITIIRFDSAVINLDTKNLQNGLTELAAHYPDIYPVYFEEILYTDAQNITSLLTDSTYSKVNNDVLKTFKNIVPIEDRMTTVYAYFKQYFPNVPLPKLYFFVSGCSRTIVTHPGYIGVGVDLYLGRDYHLYENLTEKYLIQNMDPECIPVDITGAILTSAFPQKTSKDRLLEKMLYQGKILYMLSVMLPDDSEENIIGFSTEQLNWSKKFERDVWASIIDQKHLFSTDNFIIQKYTIDAPFTQPISQEAPGRIASWIGWQIVKSYMDNNKSVTLQELAAENNFQKILEQSKYKP